MSGRWRLERSVNPSVVECCLIYSFFHFEQFRVTAAFVFRSMYFGFGRSANVFFALETMVLAPFFDKAPSLLQKPDGSVLFECMCNANPEPSVKWFFKDKELNDDRHVTKVKKMVGKYTCCMIMKNPTLADQGIYKVVATNSHGNHSVEQGYVHTCTSNEIFKTQ
ncbi:hypothetical protein L596_002812 [Steinernema carpocapsae]|uniref:Immunoglobulin subtype 2 domain-containing protein n=1 Tax=Steinernema carpocapsae TaxID=34508 RepID=A0A4U8UQS6_STECR|nr:hypothetical protein L596_002812 [Steinernema carpocapsae]